MSLKSIKNNIRSIDKTHKVTKAMEAVSAVKMRKSQERALISRPYALSALRILSRIQSGVDARRHPLIAPGEGSVTCMLLVTSDKGLAGSLNSSVIKEAARAIADTPKESVRFVCIGNKGREYFERRGYAVLKHYDNVSDDISLREMLDITNEITKLFTEKTVGRVLVAYTNFVSTFEQRAYVRQVLPIDFDELKKVIEAIVPKKGKFSEHTEDTESHPIEEGARIPYTIEPSPEEVFAELLPSLLNIELYHALLEAKASEHSARMVAMKNASDKAEEMAEELTLLFNKARQAEITSEISEIVGGMEAMAG